MGMLKNNKVNKKVKFIIVGMLTLVVFSGTVFALNSSASEMNTKVINFMNKDVELKLTQHNNATKIGKMNVYKDEELNQYILKGEKLVGYFKEKEINPTTRKAKSEFSKLNGREIADNFVKSIIDYEATIFEKYKFDKVDYVESYNEYNYTYSKYINGILTNDGITISLDENGNLMSYSAPRQGLFDNLDTPVTKNDIEIYIDEYMNKNFKDVDYKIDSLVIDYINKKYVVDCYIEVSFEEYVDVINIQYNL